MTRFERSILQTLALVASAGFLLIAVETVWFYVPEFFR